MQKWIRFVSLSLTLCALLFVIACRNANNNSSSSKSLSLALASGVEGDALKQAAREYEARTGTRVTIAEFPYDDLFAKEQVDLNAQTGAYDVVMLDDPWFPRFAEPGWLTPLAPLYQARNQSGPDADFVATSLALCKHPYESGQLYALPYVGNSQLFFYRKDLFEKYNLKEPQTWDDVLTAAKMIDERERTGAPDGSRVHGYVMRAARGNSVVADFLPIFWAFGAEMFDEGGKPAVNSPQGINALKFMLELGKYAPPGYASFNATEVSAHLLQGTAAMSINWPAWISAFGDPTKSKVIGKMAFTTLPGAQGAGRAEIGNWLVAIPKGSRNQEAAFDFITWATAAEQMKKSALAGNPPTRRSVFNDAELVTKFPSYPAQLKSLESSKPRPRTPLWNEIENTFGIYLSRANSGELTAEEAMNQANAEISRIVERRR
ncbi:MAG TPA: ABC transporter substrate-binding protein [Blastocatellia bacterium]|nr:ABC transporter substrate-binding protein [Blastocatellia bacterium]